MQERKGRKLGKWPGRAYYLNKRKWYYNLCGLSYENHLSAVAWGGITGRRLLLDEIRKFIILSVPASYTCSAKHLETVTLDLQDQRHSTGGRPAQPVYNDFLRIETFKMVF